MHPHVTDHSSPEHFERHCALWEGVHRSSHWLHVLPWELLPRLNVRAEVAQVHMMQWSSSLGLHVGSYARAQQSILSWPQNACFSPSLQRKCPKLFSRLFPHVETNEHDDVRLQVQLKSVEKKLLGKYGYQMGRCCISVCSYSRLTAGVYNISSHVYYFLFDNF